MGKQEEIRQALAAFAKKHGPTPTLLANVVSVNEDEDTCILDDEGLMVPEVRLRPVIDDTEGLTVYPKIGTWCLAVRIEEDDDWLAVAFGEISKWRLKVGEALIEQGSKLTISKGSNNLKHVIELIVQAVQVITPSTPPDAIKLTQALSELNDIMQ